MHDSAHYQGMTTSEALRDLSTKGPGSRLTEFERDLLTLAADTLEDGAEQAIEIQEQVIIALGRQIAKVADDQIAHRRLLVALADKVSSMVTDDTQTARLEVGAVLLDLEEVGITAVVTSDEPPVLDHRDRPLDTTIPGEMPAAWQNTPVMDQGAVLAGRAHHDWVERPDAPSCFCAFCGASWSDTARAEGPCHPSQLEEAPDAG